MRPHLVAEVGDRGTIWEYPVGRLGEPYTSPHPAWMHERLARDLILSYSRTGDVVCDPFAGAATTVKMCLLLGRDSISWEIHAPYYAPGERRLRDARRTVTQRLLDRFKLD